MMNDTNARNGRRFFRFATAGAADIGPWTSATRACAAAAGTAARDGCVNVGIAGANGAGEGAESSAATAPDCSTTASDCAAAATCTATCWASAGAASVIVGALACGSAEKSIGGVGTKSAAIVSFSATGERSPVGTTG